MLGHQVFNHASAQEDNINKINKHYNSNYSNQIIFELLDSRDWSMEMAIRLTWVFTGWIVFWWLNKYEGKEMGVVTYIYGMKKRRIILEIWSFLLLLKEEKKKNCFLCNLLVHPLAWKRTWYLWDFMQNLLGYIGVGWYYLIGRYDEIW